MAIKWLRRAYSVINSQDVDKLSGEGVQSRLAICHNLIQGLIATGHSDYVAEATDLVAFVETEIGDKPVVLHWRLEILQNSPNEVFDAESYASLLQRLTRVFDYSEEGFSFLLHHIRGLFGKKSKLGRAVLYSFLNQKILHSEKPEWIGRAILLQLWMAASNTETEDIEADLEVLLGLLNQIYQTMGKPLPPDMSGAAHAVSVWSRYFQIILIYLSRCYGRKWKRLPLRSPTR